MAIAVAHVARELTLELLQKGEQPQQLRPSCQSLEELEQRLLEEAIGLRERGSASLSLWLLERALQAGLRNPWIHDNRARALVEQGERQQARAIWLELAERGSGALASTAAEMAAAQEQTLREAMEAIAQQHGYSQPVLEAGERDLLLRALESLIRTREQNWPALSLELAETVQALGWRSPWLLDNQARALVMVGRREEALALWRQLTSDADEGVAHAADEMLGLHGGRDQTLAAAGYPGWQEDRQRAEQAAALRAEQPEQAELLLLRALLELPEPRCCRQRLEAWLAEDAGSGGFEELRADEAALRVQERLLALVEAQLKPAAEPQPG